MSFPQNASHPDPTLATLFRDEAIQLVPSFRPLLSTPRLSEQDLSNLIRAAHQLKSAANIIQLSEWAQLGDALKSWAGNAEIGSELSAIQKGALSQLLQIIEGLEELPGEQIAHNLAKTKHRIKQLMSPLSGLSGKTGFIGTPLRGYPIIETKAAKAQPERRPGMMTETTRSLMDLFRAEAESLSGTLNQGLLSLEKKSCFQRQSSYADARGPLFKGCGKHCQARSPGGFSPCLGRLPGGLAIRQDYFEFRLERRPAEGCGYFCQNLKIQGRNPKPLGRGKRGTSLKPHPNHHPFCTNQSRGKSHSSGTDNSFSKFGTAGKSHFYRTSFHP